MPPQEAEEALERLIRAGQSSPRGKKMDQTAILDHQFVVAAYAITWAIQLGYLAWLGLKWRALKRHARPLAPQSALNCFPPHLSR